MDLVKHLTPSVISCDTFSCTPTEDSKPGHNEEMVKHMLKKFISPVIANFADHQTDKEKPFIRFANKPLDRKYQALS